MTARAIRLVGRCSPNDGLVISGVTARAGNAAVVRPVSRRYVGVGCDGYPRGGAVTRVAGSGRDEMGGGLPGGRGAVVARVACTGRYAGVAECRRFPRGGAVTNVAGLCGGYVGCGLAGGGGAVVASCATARHHAGVTESRWLPRGGAMAGVACQRGR